MKVEIKGKMPPTLTLLTESPNKKKGTVTRELLVRGDKAVMMEIYYPRKGWEPEQRHETLVISGTHTSTTLLSIANRMINNGWELDDVKYVLHQAIQKELNKGLNADLDRLIYLKQQYDKRNPCRIWFRTLPP